jgi:hypothetical protein
MKLSSNSKLVDAATRLTLVAQAAAASVKPASPNRKKRTQACFASVKSARQLVGKSVLQIRAMRAFELAPGVASFSDNSPSLFLKRWRSISYTPDLIVQWTDDSKWLVAVLTRTQSNLPRMQAKFRAAAIAALVAGYHFVVLTDVHLDRIDLATMERATPTRRFLWRRVQVIRSLTYECGLEDAPQHIDRVLAQAWSEAPTSSLAARLGLELSGTRKARKFSWQTPSSEKGGSV